MSTRTAVSRDRALSLGLAALQQGTADPGSMNVAEACAPVVPGAR